MRNRTEAMNRLMRKAWTKGWVPVMGAEIPYDDVPSPDGVLLKDGEMVIFYMVFLPSGNSKRQTGDRSDNLLHLESRAMDSGYDSMDNVESGFVVAKSSAARFYWMDRTSTNAHAQGDYETLDEVLD